MSLPAAGEIRRARYSSSSVEALVPRELRRSAEIRRFFLVDVDVVLVLLVGLVGAAADAEHLEGVRDGRLDGFDDLLLGLLDAALLAGLLGLELAEGAAPQAEGFGAARRVMAATPARQRNAWRMRMVLVRIVGLTLLLWNASGWPEVGNRWIEPALRCFSWASGFTLLASTWAERAG